MKDLTLKGILLASILMAPCVHSSDIKFFTHGIDGKTFKDASGELRGNPHAGKRAFSVELVREMMKEMGVKPRISKSPFARALKLLKKSGNVAVFTIARRADREAFVKWVGPLLQDTVYLYEAKARANNLSSLDAAKNGKKICVLRGGNHEKYLKKNGFKKIFPNNSYEQCFKMMVEGRVDYAVLASKGLSETMMVAKMKADLFSPAMKLYDVENYLGFSKNVSDDQIAKWQKAFDDIVASGRYQQIETGYLLP